jgi:hypothetical protein
MAYFCPARLEALQGYKIDDDEDSFSLFLFLYPYCGRIRKKDLRGHKGLPRLTKALFDTARDDPKPILDYR